MYFLMTKSQSCNQCIETSQLYEVSSNAYQEEEQEGLQARSTHGDALGGRFMQLHLCHFNISHFMKIHEVS